MASLKTALGSVKLPALNRERLIEWPRQARERPQVPLDRPTGLFEAFADLLYHASVAGHHRDAERSLQLRDSFERVDADHDFGPVHREPGDGHRVGQIPGLLD